MKRPLRITTARAAVIWKEMLWLRRELYRDAEFFKMPAVWERLCEDLEGCTIKVFRDRRRDDFERRAGVMMLGETPTLVVDERLMENARGGCMLSNFILAHELGHVALDHHAKGAVVKNFQLFAGPNGASNTPPTVEECEANFAGVVFQCGQALADKRWDPLRLAKRASSDPHSVREARKRVTLDVFAREVERQKHRYKRVIL